MKQLNRLMIGCAVFLSATTANAQMGAPAPSAVSADVYHVHFTKAVPGKAAELGKLLETGNPAAAVPGHFIVLRHQQGDDWDYAVVEHVGAKATVDPAPAAAAAPGRDLRAWHADTFVSGPSWSAFTKAMGLDAADKAKPSIYSVAIWRAVPGHREQLEKALATTGPSAPAGQVLLTHLEGGPWQYLGITRYNSWQDFAADQAASATGTAADGWAEVRAHGSYHHDTLADRIAPK